MKSPESPPIVSPNNSHVSPVNRCSRIDWIGKSKATQQQRARAISSVSLPGSSLLVVFWAEAGAKGGGFDGPSKSARGGGGKGRGGAVRCGGGMGVGSEIGEIRLANLHQRRLPDFRNFATSRRSDTTVPASW